MVMVMMVIASMRVVGSCTEDVECKNCGMTFKRFKVMFGMKGGLVFCSDKCEKGYGVKGVGKENGVDGCGC